MVMANVDSKTSSKFNAEKDGLAGEIGRLFGGINDSRIQIGKLIDAYLEGRGGTQYRDATLKRLATHPKVQASEQQLRRCWDLYRLAKEHGAELASKCPDLHTSALYQIARFMRTKLSAEKQKNAILAAGEEASDGRMNVADIAKMVSSRLASTGNLRRTHKTESRQKNVNQSESSPSPKLIERPGGDAVVDGLTLNPEAVPRGDRSINGVIHRLKKLILRLGHPEQPLGELVAMEMEEAADELVGLAAQVRRAGKQKGDDRTNATPPSRSCVDGSKCEVHSAKLTMCAARELS